MVKYRCIGKGTTDNNGIAHITHDCEGNILSDTGYSGTGKGLVDVVASTINPSDITGSAFQSDVCEIADTLKYDNGVSDDYKDIWTKNTSSAVFERQAEYSLLRSGQIYTTFTPGTDFAIDMELCLPAGAGNYFWYCTQSGSNFGGCSLNNLGLQLNTWNNIHMEFTDGKIIVSSDNSPTAHILLVNYNQNVGIGFRFNVNGSISEIMFRNFKIYKI